MLIRYQALESSLKKEQYPVYVLFGQDHYLLNAAALTIKQSWRQQGECDTKIIDISSPSDWSSLLDEANSYSLFSELVLLDVRYGKKTFDSSGQKILQQYLNNVNPRCLLVLQAPNLSAKQLTWLNQQPQVLSVQIFSLTEDRLKNWIVKQLNQLQLQYEKDIPGLIYEHTRGNMLACAQAIEKLSLTADPDKRLTVGNVQLHLSDQCEYQLYELADACLEAHAEKSIHLLRQARHNGTEPTLILWLITQEIRQLIQLTCLQRQSLSLTAACNKLKIWQQKTKLYHQALQRLPLPNLYQLLHTCQQLDEWIKTNQNTQIWDMIEQLILAFTGYRPAALPL